MSCTEIAHERMRAYLPQSAFHSWILVNSLRKRTMRRMNPDNQTPKMSFTELLRRTRDEALARPADPWTLRLERVRGKVGDDAIERISTQTLFDHLDVAQRSRGASTGRRLAKIMRELGWTPVRVRDLTRGG